MCIIKILINLSVISRMLQSVPLYPKNLLILHFGNFYILNMIEEKIWLKQKKNQKYRGYEEIFICITIDTLCSNNKMQQ